MQRFTSSEFTFPRSFRQSLAVGSRSDFVFALGSAPVSKTLASWVIELRTPLYNSYAFSSVAQYTTQHRDVQRGYSKQGNPIQPPLFQHGYGLLVISTASLSSRYFSSNFVSWTWSGLVQSLGEYRLTVHKITWCFRVHRKPQTQTDMLCVISWHLFRRSYAVANGRRSLQWQLGIYFVSLSFKVVPWGRRCKACCRAGVVLTFSASCGSSPGKRGI